jgi:alpha-beta hydrolase superfamily lysophospholipase
MKKAFFVALLCGALVVSAAPTEVNYLAQDNIKVYAEYHPVASAKALIVLFHQANGSRFEYKNIAPKLYALGFSTLAVDQRSGGGQFGGSNKTAAQVSAVGYLAALPDLTASLRYAKDTLKASKVIVWGSSYSSALVFLLAAQNLKDVAGVVAFSPDEMFGQTNTGKRCCQAGDSASFYHQQRF